MKNPQQELDRIYEFLQLPSYSHTFENITPKANENDEVYRLDNMHTVRDRVEKIHRDNSKYLSEYVMNKYSHMEFWKNRTSSYSIFGL